VAEVISGKNFIPLGNVKVEDLSLSELGLLLKIVLEGNPEKMYECPLLPEIKENDSILQNLVKKGYLNVDNTSIYPNFQKDLLKPLVWDESIYNINNNINNNIKPRPQKKSSPKKKEEIKPPLAKQKISESVSPRKSLLEYVGEEWRNYVSDRHLCVFDFINKCRWECVPRLKPLGKGEGDGTVSITVNHYKAINERLKTHSLNDCLLVIKSWFDWSEFKKMKDYATKNTRATPTAILGGYNFDKRLYMAKQSGTKLEGVNVPVQISQKGDAISDLYNAIVSHWNEIQKKKIKILFDGEINQIQIASMAYRRFIKILGADANPSLLPNPEKTFRECYQEAKRKGGSLITALDELYINGKVYSVKEKTISVP